ncbi:MAG: ComEC family competence protein, partial [Phaeodactylibacter sp.]|nr:ComEC family competence protein [Phaeodactylibacter sp.]
MTEVLVNWKRFPFIRLLLPFVIGLGLGLRQQESSITLIVWLLAPSLLVLYLLGLRRSKQVESVFFALLLFGLLGSLGWLNGVTASEQSRKDHYSRQLNEKIWSGTIEEVQQKTNYDQLKVALQSCSPDTVLQWQRISGRLLVFLPKADSILPVPGQVLVFKGNPFPVSTAKNPFAFDYAAYLASQQIHFQVYLKTGNYQLGVEQTGSALSRWRHHRLAQLQQIWPEPRHHAIFEAMVFGEKSNLPKELRQLYAEVGALHVLAVSGLHVGIILVLLQALLKRVPFLNRRRSFQGLAVLLGVWLYVGLAGAGPSVVRAGTMFSFILLGGLLQRNGNIYNSLAASAFFLLLLQPYWLYSPGFQLSYLAVFGIVHFQQLIYRLWIPSYRWLDYAWKLTTVSIAAQVLTFPISLYYFQQFPMHFWLSGLVIVPLAPLLIVLGGLGLLLQQTLPEAATYFAQGVAVFLDGVHFVLEKIQALPGSLVPVPDFDGVEVIGMYAAILVLMAWMKNKNSRWIYLLTSLLLSLQIWKCTKEWYRQNHPLLVIYTHHQGVLVDMIYQGHIWSRKDDGLPERSIPFIASPLRTKYKVKKVELLPTQSSMHLKHYWQIPGCFQFFQLRVGHYSRLPAIPVDILLIDAPIRETIADFQEMLVQREVRQLVLAAHLKSWERLEIQQFLEQTSVPVHDLAVAGAY